MYFSSPKNRNKNKEMNHLAVYGWNEELSRHKQTSSFKDLPHGRVGITHKTCYEVTTFPIWKIRAVLRIVPMPESRDVP